ncbi:SMI1/KNR4 family protein [Luteolibacter arcticus]|uniref:SMI1/KNR4 family protein n=1 Tax=Luteolibacter arcticus TaxID=1581411 RepID=A0ABT3GSS8_9BACT|nr:SMI1/KNR4 family protein [Luteolibacter arcticus]MCW1926558.1 SMI1/KNR4 family protein [Luteolibacter arcticus]
MKADDIVRIERELAVELPADLRRFLAGTRDDFDPDEVAVLDDAEAMIERTLEYRRGFAGMPPWPESWVYLGDEADACPYCLDCATGRVAQLHKGDAGQEPLGQHESFAAYRQNTRREIKAGAAAMEVPSRWRDAVRFYTPVTVALVLMFVVVPLCAYGISVLMGWFFK